MQLILGEQKTFLADIFGWWYSQGIREFLVYLKAFFLKITDLFSVKMLLKTFLAPWKRDIVSLEGLPFNLMIRVIIFNLVARLIGAVIKTFILFIYFLALAIFLSLALSLVLIWLLLPLISILGIIFGIVLIFSA